MSSLSIIVVLKYLVVIINYIESSLESVLYSTVLLCIEL